MIKRQTRYTKIVATLGPASYGTENLRQLVAAGVNVFRLNFSHGTHQDHGKAILDIRQVETEIGVPLAVMADLQGPKYRLGFFEHPVQLQKDSVFILDLDAAPGSTERAYFPHEDVYAVVQQGNILLVNDGQIQLMVEKASATKIQTRVIVGGLLSSHKGVNLPDTDLDACVLTLKDREDLSFVLDKGVDYIALSFVQTPDDVKMARAIIKDRARIISKIEKPLAVRSMTAILKESDGILVARGDLGVEMLPEEVPNAQRHLVREAREQGKPVIIATQMMESMIQNPSPTRAEASDVANAVVEGADAVMLSGETAAGAYPIESVRFMDRILRTAEADLYKQPQNAGSLKNRPLPFGVDDATIQAATWMVEAIGSAVIVTVTSSGTTTLRAAQQRHPVEIFAITSSEQLARQLTLVWGVTATHKMNPQNYTEVADQACTYLLENNWVQPGDPVVITAGIPFKTPGSTNMMRVAYAGVKESYAPL